MQGCEFFFGDDDGFNCNEYDKSPISFNVIVQTNFADDPGEIKITYKLMKIACGHGVDDPVPFSTQEFEALVQPTIIEPSNYYIHMWEASYSYELRNTYDEIYLEVYIDNIFMDNTRIYSHAYMYDDINSYLEGNTIQLNVYKY